MKLSEKLMFCRRWRMHVSLEELLNDTDLIGDIQELMLGGLYLPSPCLQLESPPLPIYVRS